MVAMYEYAGPESAEDRARQIALHSFVRAFGDREFAVEHVFSDGAHRFTATVKE
ncbi:hypothetical protein D3C80_2108810 [compost metagenome]